MAVRYFVERFGSDAVAALVALMAGGQDLPTAFEGAAGIAYADFRRDFPDWVAGWTDPEREGLRAYVGALSEVMSREQEVSTLRARGLRSDLEVSQRLANALSHRGGRRGAALECEGPGASSHRRRPPRQRDRVLRQDGGMARLEVAYLRSPSQEGLDAANGMLDQINARESGIYRSLQIAISAYRLE